MNKSNFNIFSFGEVLFDIYSNEKIIGGAPFNFIYHIKKLTGEGTLISRVGKDKNGEEILEKLQNNKFDTSFIQIDESESTGVVNVELNEKKIPTFNIQTSSAYDFIEDFDFPKNIIDDSTLFYFGTLVQRNEISKKSLNNLSKNKFKFFTDLNIRQNFFTKEVIKKSLEIASIVKINEVEFNIIAHYFFTNPKNVFFDIYKLMDDFEIEMLSLTLGEKGAILFKGKECNKYVGKVKNLVDTVGAGDAYSAIFCLGYLNNWDYEKINKIASDFACEICCIKGAIPDNDNIYEKYRGIINN